VAALVNPTASFVLITCQIVAQQAPAVLILVAVHAQVFPVGSVRRVIVMVAIFVMNGEELSVVFIKLPGALGTDQPMNLERPFPVWAGRSAEPLQLPYGLINRQRAVHLPRPLVLRIIKSPASHSHFLAKAPGSNGIDRGGSHPGYLKKKRSPNRVRYRLES
jgi:hypothetical protein